MNLKEHIIEINDEKLDDWNLLDWDNPNPYDYRYYKMLGLALFERVFGKNAFPLDAAYNSDFDYYKTPSTFLSRNAYSIYSLCKNSILDFKLLFSLYDAYLYYFLKFINRDNISSKNYKELSVKLSNGSTDKMYYLNKCFFYTMNDLPLILNNKQLEYGVSLEIYKDFLIGMYQMAHMMRWRSIDKIVCEYEVGNYNTSHYASTYIEAFDKAYDRALYELTNYSRVSTSIDAGTSYVRRFKTIRDSFLFDVNVSITKNYTITCPQKLPYNSIAELYIGKYDIFSGGLFSVDSKYKGTPYLTSPVMLYDRKNVNENENITFKLEDLEKKDYMIKLPSYDKDDEFYISEYYYIDSLLIYDCNNSYKLKAN